MLLARGPFGYVLTRPVRSEALLRTLLGLLGPQGMVAEPVAAASPRKPERARVRILVAEDNRINQQVAIGILANLGCERVDVAANGKEAITCLEHVPYDMVLMDCEMPEMDGFEATAIIRDPRSAVRNHEVPVIALTAHSVEGDREKCLEAGMNDYLDKPVMPDALAAVVDRWGCCLAEAAVAPVAPPPAPALEAGQDDSPLLDHEALYGRVLGDRDLAQVLTEAFLEELPERLGELREAVRAEDMKKVKRGAHTLKGSAANLGAVRLTRSLLATETAAEAGDAQAVRRLLAVVEEQARLTTEVMRDGP